jgi:hypothetical protein
MVYAINLARSIDKSYTDPEPGSTSLISTFYIAHPNGVYKNNEQGSICSERKRQSSKKNANIMNAFLFTP